MREVMSLFLEVLQTPALPQAKIDLYKSQVWDVHFLTHAQFDYHQAVHPELSMSPLQA